MRRHKQIISVILLCLVAAVGVFLGRGLRMRQEKAFKSVLDFDALKAQGKGKS